MEDINESNIKTQDYFNDHHTVNEIIYNSNKNDLKNINNKQENISEEKRDFKEFKEIIESFGTDPNQYIEEQNKLESDYEYSERYNKKLKSEQKQIEIIKVMPQVLKELLKQKTNYKNIKGMYKCWRVYTFLHRGITHDLADIIKNNRKLFEEIDNTPKFNQTLAEKYNNNELGIKTTYDSLGVNIDFSKINNINTANEISTPRINRPRRGGMLPFFTEISYKFLIESLLDYRIMYRLIPNKQESYSAYKKFLNVLKRCYYNGEINKDDYKLILRTILYNSLAFICSYDKCKTLSYGSMRDVIQLCNQLTNNNTFLVPYCSNLELYNNIKLITDEIIKDLAIVYYNNINAKDEIETITNEILKETIMPCINELILNDIARWPQQEFKRSQQELEKQLSKCREAQSRLDSLKNNIEAKKDIFKKINNVINNPDVLAQKFDNDLNVTKNITNAINGLQNKDKLQNIFSNNMGNGIINKNIKSKYIIDNINSYTRDNRALKLAKYTKGK